jgi:hypothetical protein
MEIKVPGFISLLLIGDDEGEVHAIHGRIELSSDGHLFLGNSGARIPLEPEWLERAKPISQELRSIFGEASQCFIPLSVCSLPEGADVSSLVPTGLNLGTAP